MGVFGKVKQFFGAGTVKVKLDASPNLSRDMKSVSGTVEVTAKSDQQVLKIVVELTESWKKHKSDPATAEKQFSLGKVTLDGFDIKQGEIKKLTFDLPVKFMDEMGGLHAKGFSISFGSVGVGTGDDSVSHFLLIATADVQGAAFDPNCVVTMNAKG